MKTSIKLLRVLKDWRQADLERVSRISQPRLSRLERGEIMPTQEEVAALSKALLDGGENAGKDS